jgi:glutamate synthase (NADPH/NADH) small chain
VGKVTGFLEYEREVPARRPIAERVNDYFEIYQDFGDAKVETQAARCMDCGVPFCNTGCPLNNLIPDWNDLVYRDRWREAVRTLHATNNFPEFTGRICPAPCEAACVLGINAPPVTIKVIERTIIDHAFEQGWINPEPPSRRTGKRVAVVGSGPAGLAAAQQLARSGHSTTLFEKSDRLGGLLRYGIPDFKMEKRWIDRRLEQMAAEGVEFVTNANLHASDLAEFDAAVLAMGAEQPRDMSIEGRQLRGIHFAMDFLPQQNRRVAGDPEASAPILATGKRVIIIGGGDTGADCLGTSHRQKAASVKQLEIMPMPPENRAASTPWPLWPLQLRVESSHEEGGERHWSASTTRFTGDKAGKVKQLHLKKLDTGEEVVVDADLVLLAMGFTGPVRAGLVEETGVKLDARGNIETTGYATSVPGIFAAGDARRGQSLVVWAIAEGRKAAEEVGRYLQQ